MIITLTNDFHNTSCQKKIGKRDYLTYIQAASAWRALCGIKDCKCSGISRAGTRGAQYLPSGQRVALIDDGQKICLES